MGLRSHITLVTSLGLAELVIRTSLDAAKQATGLVSLNQKIVFAVEMFVKAANSQAGRFHHSRNAGAVQPFRAKPASSILQDAAMSPRLVVRVVTHTYQDYIRNPIASNYYQSRVSSASAPPMRSWTRTW
jgi:hypothetical protein